ncbi:MAG: ABC transporter substrate-binding protein [Anaerolineae bacterium]
MEHRPAYALMALAIAILALVSSCEAPTPSAEKQLVFMAGYKPQANLPFVGVYVAQEKGFFADENLEVDIRHSTGGGEHMQLLVAGTVHITTQDAAVLLKRRADPGLPLVSIALIGQRGQQAYVALTESGIASLEDWAGRRVGFKGTPPPDLLALIDVTGLSETEVDLINVGFDPRVLVEGLVDVYPVFASNEPYTLRSWGYELEQWEAVDYGIPTLGLTYVTTEEQIEANPDALARFTRAALRGIAYAEEHRDEVVEIVMAYAGPDADPEHIRFMLDTELETAHSEITEAHTLGWQTTEQWQALLDSLLRYDAIAGPVSVEEMFTNEFLDETR